jgi:hypothetical protein
MRWLLDIPCEAIRTTRFLDERIRWSGRFFRRGGADPDVGLRLTSSFLNAGLARPNLKAELPIGGEAGSYLYGWIAETLRTLLPKIEQFGLACPEEMEIDTLAQRMESEAVELQSELIGPVQIGAWVRKF